MNVNKTKIADINYNYVIDSLRFDLFGDVMIKDFKWKTYLN